MAKLSHAMVVLAMVLAGCVDEVEDPAAVEQESVDDPGKADGWSLAPGVSELAGVSPTLPTGDLAAVDAVIGSAPVVGLGESIHASGGYYAFKLRMIQHLVRDRGFRVLAIETPRTPARKLDEYIQDCRGKDLRASVAGAVFTVFTDDNFASMMGWLCAWNVGHPTDRVRIFGFDVQQPHLDYPVVRQFLQTYAWADSASLLWGLGSCKLDQDETPYSTQAYQACLAGLDRLEAYLAYYRSWFVGAVGATQMRLLDLAVLGLRSNQGEMFYFTSNVPLSYTARDVAMTRVFLTLRQLYFPTQRAIVWAHNFHLAADFRGVQQPQRTGAITFGQGLRDALGRSYVALGFVGRRVEISWPGQAPNTPTAAPLPGSLTARLAAFGRRWLFADTRSATVGTAAQALLGPNDPVGVVSRMFDGIVYFDYSPGMRPMF